MTTTGIARVLWAGVTVCALAAGLAFAAASPAAAQPITNAVDCAASFRFAEDPVPVVKTADGETVLASVEWGYSADHNLCYLALDDRAIAVLRANEDKIVGTTPPQDAAAAARCHRAYNPERGFAAEPVPVVKTADGQTVLATVRWGYSADHNLCYLVLDDQAIAVLRTAATPPPAPEELEVLVQRTVGDEGAELAAGQVSVSVPAGAVDGASVVIREALGEFGSGVGGEVVSVEHQGPVRAPITVAWDVGHLSEAEQELLVLVRWDDGAASWVRDDADFEIQEGVLTARIQQWSVKGLVACLAYPLVPFCPVAADLILDSVDLSDLSQSLQELLGRRVDAPKCNSGALPEWVRDAGEPFGGDNSAPIRLCYERGPDESVRVKMANNRVYTQVVRITQGSSLANSEPLAFDPVRMDGHDLRTPAGWVQQGGYLVLTDRDEGVVLIPPLRTVQLDIAPSRQTVWFRSEVNRDTLLVDLLIYAADVGGEFAPPGAGNTLEIGAEVVAIWRKCALNKLHAFKMTGDLAQDLLEVQFALISCSTEAFNPLTIANQLIAREVEDLFAGITARLPKRYTLYTKIIEAVGYAADHVLRGTAPDPGWSISVVLGGYRPSIKPTPSEDSNIAAGDYHTCALRSDRTIACWGSNRDRRTDAPEGRYTAVSTNLGGLLGQHSCAIREDNRTIDCWGKDDRGLLNRPIWVNRPDRYTALAVGGRHTCAIRADRSMACWGDNSYGQAEPPSDQFAREFVSVAAGTWHTCAITTYYDIACWGDSSLGKTDTPPGWFTAVAAGSDHSCAIRDDRTIACWGNNGSGQADAPAGEYTAVSAGDQHTCAIRTDRTIACWGYNGSGQTDAPAGTFAAVSAGLYHSCATKTDHAIVCWGDNEFGQSTPELDDGFEEPNEIGNTFKAIATQFMHTCGIRTDNTITCWGANDSGQTDAPIRQFAAVATGQDHTCGIKTNKTIACWGANIHGQATPPSGQFTAITVGSRHSCGIRADRTVDCWGWNRYREAIPPSGQFTAITVGSRHSCGIRTDKTVACWGNNDNGQTNAPSGQFTITTIGYEYSCGLKVDKTVACWGNNHDGQTNAPSGQFTTISSGSYRTCGIKADKTIACWGLLASTKQPGAEGQFTTITSGGNHFCGIRTDGTISCWWGNYLIASNVPPGQFTAITSGSSHSCGIRADRTVACWGSNMYRQTDVPS